MPPTSTASSPSTCSAGPSHGGCTCSTRCDTGSSTSRARLHHPMWLEDCPVDLDYHLRRVQVPAPGGRRELDQVIGEIASTPLDRSRPLWEFHFAEGMADDRFALIGKVHHTLADGVASANLLARLMDLAGSAQDERRGLRHLRSALETAAAVGGATRPLSEHGRVAAADLGRCPRGRTRAQAHQGAAGPPRHGENLSRRRRPFSIMWFLRSGHSRRPRCRWPKSRKPQSISA